MENFPNCLKIKIEFIYICLNLFKSYFLNHIYKMSNYKFVYDTETSGLPKREKGKPYDYENSEQFDTARLISISWLLLNEKNEIVEKKTYFIKPDNFEVSQESINIHGLSYEFLIENGVEIHEMFSHLNGIFESYNITQIIAHNVDFDINILKSELYRYDYNITLGQFRAIPLYCTMKEAQKKMCVRKWPKLSEAYTHFYGDNITNAHDAEFDTLHCYKIYLKLME